MFNSVTQFIPQKTSVFSTIDLFSHNLFDYKMRIKSETLREFLAEFLGTFVLTVSTVNSLFYCPLVNPYLDPKYIKYGLTSNLECELSLKI